MNRIFRELIAAVLSLTGYLLIGYGCWLIWHPLAYFWSGVLLCIMSSGALKPEEVAE